MKTLKVFSDCHIKICLTQTKSYFENPWYHFLEESMFLLLALKKPLRISIFLRSDKN